MNERILGDILAEIWEEEISDFDNLPQFKASLRHKLAMKRIFTLFENNSQNLISTSQRISHSRHTHLSIRKKLIIIFALIVCAVLMTGFIFSYVSKNFHGTVYNEYTKLFATNTENCLETIKYEYCLTDLPDGFELTERVFSLVLGVSTQYRNEMSGKEIAFDQFPKKVFGGNFNTEKHEFEEIEINGHNGLCLDFSDNEHDSSIIIWDNNDYILQLDGNLSKKELIEIAKSAKVIEK